MLCGEFWELEVHTALKQEKYCFKTKQTRKKFATAPFSPNYEFYFYLEGRALLKGRLNAVLVFLFNCFNLSF